MERRTMRLIFACLVTVAWPSESRAEEGPDPVFEKPEPVTMDELTKRTTQGVSALEVNDYAPGHYRGPLTPSPPHADMNAKKAVVVFWRDYSFGSVGQFFVPDGKRYQSFVTDHTEYSKDMELNRWTARRVFYVMLGTAGNWGEVRRIGRSWLDKGAACARPESIADLR